MDPSRATPLVASASAPDPQALMAAYPFASSTPSAHVSRHLSTLSSASSVPSFMMHGQQHYQNDPEVRQYAARALEMEVQQSVHQGYAPPAHWSQSQYIAPVETYPQYPHGGSSGHALPNPVQQQYGYQQGSRPEFHAQNQSSQYQPSSPQTSIQVSQSHRYHTPSRHMSRSTGDQSVSLASSKPHSQTYPRQQYSTNYSSTPSLPSTSKELQDVNLQYQNHPGGRPRQRQASHSAVDPTAYTNHTGYPSQSTATVSYSSKLATSSPYSQPQSSGTSYHPQSQPGTVSQSRTAQIDPYASAFLAPLASHQFAPRLSQPVSTLPRHISDSHVAYSSDGRSTYPEGARPVYSADGRYLYSADAQGYAATSQKPISGSSQARVVSQSHSSQPLQRSSSLNQQQAGSHQGVSLEHNYSRDFDSSANARARPIHGHASQAQLGQQSYQDHYGYHNQPQTSQSNQASEGARGTYPDERYMGKHQGQGQVYNTYQQAQGQINISSSQPEKSYYHPQPSASHAQPRRERPESITHHAALPSRGQPHPQPSSTSQIQLGQQAEQVHGDSGIAQPHSTQGNTSSLAQIPGNSQSQRYPQPEVDAQSHASTSKTSIQQPGVSTSEQQQHQKLQVEQTPEVQAQVQAQPQHLQASQAQLDSSTPPATQLPTAQAQAHPRDVYAPLAGRPLRGRGLGRPLYHGPPRVLQGGPPRVLAPQSNQSLRPQAQAHRAAHQAHTRQQPSMPNQQSIGAPTLVNSSYRQVQEHQTAPGFVPSGSVRHPPLGATQGMGVSASIGGGETGDCSMEDVSTIVKLSEIGTANELQAMIQETKAMHPNTPPPLPYEPLAKDRSKAPQGTIITEQGQGQEVNGYATQLQLQQLSLRSQQSTPQPPSTSESLRATQIHQPAQQPTITRPQHARSQAPQKHTAEDSAAHFDAFLSAGTATVEPKPKPANATPSIGVIQRPSLPAKNLSTSSTSSTRPRLSPVIELPQRTSFVTPRKDKKWREPLKDGSTDTPKRLDTSSPDSITLSPMKRKRDPDADVGSKTVKRMMSMSIENSGTPSLSRTYDATIRTPGSSRMQLVVELPLRKTANGVSPEQSRVGTSAIKRDPHIEKLCSLIDDVIEAEDALDPEVAAESGNTGDWFSAKTSDWSAPLLAPSVMARLAQLAGRRGTRLGDVDSGNLTRLLKILGRSVAKGEDIDPFSSSSGNTVPGSAVKPKLKGKKKGKGGAEEETEAEDGKEKEDVELTNEDFERLGRVLEVAKEAAIAADCVLTFLSTEKLPKQVRMEPL
ncbi:unnamed protein product [Rhizoctonia solani]|uniref:Uncharacterized protein n=1 Tax=Rhizoctonia solani TaxID=456999 RepID=A0A8H3DS05_9AGAM|nr:unnamed protein product [Rhizoctonia solani]